MSAAASLLGLAFVVGCGVVVLILVGLAIFVARHDRHDPAGAAGARSLQRSHARRRRGF